MEDKQVFQIAGEPDIVMARLRVRRYVQSKGLGTKDQALVSLVVSSLAHALELDGVDRGEIAIDSLRHGNRVAVRVICSKEYGAANSLTDLLKGVEWMVDDLKVEPRPPNGIQVTVIKWSIPQDESADSLAATQSRS
jgi:hypothetical protein